MRALIMAMGVLLALPVVFYGAVIVASESGEVVVLHTEDAAGETHRTRLWVVEHAGAEWLRAGDPESAWLARLEARPEVRVERNGAVTRHKAIPVREDGVRAAVNAGIEAKYGFADRLISVMIDRSESVPVKLAPPGS